jgi:outer membrane protein OmpA-like peptidoglycan-associated protein
MNKALLATPLIFALALPACTTFDAYTGEEKTSKTATGAGIGAGVGAVAAYLRNRDASSKDRKRRMLQGAGIGAIAGGGVGYYMDTQEAKLRKQLRNSGVSVVRDGDKINLVMPGNITFDTNSGEVKASFYDVLNSVALVLNEYDKTLIVVSGHTDSVGRKQYNQRLSEKRAGTVGRYLRSQKINPNRIEAIGAGEDYPIASNKTASGRQQNRRVELTLEPITAKN